MNRDIVRLTKLDLLHCGTAYSSLIYHHVRGIFSLVQNLTSKSQYFQ